MKKIMISILSVVFCVVISQAYAQEKPKPPFDKVKENSLKGEATPSGAHWIGWVAQMNGETLEFRMAYSPTDESMCVGGTLKEYGYIIVCWAPKVGYALIPNPWTIIPLEEKEALEIAFAIFRRMVELRLL